MFSEKYFCHLKTGQSEMRAYSNLSEQTKDQMVPMLEITKSRISKNNQFGDVYKQVDKVKELLGGRPCVIDLIQDPAFSNPEMDRIVSDSAGGYEQWCEFLDCAEIDGAIPMIQFSGRSSEEDERRQIAFLHQGFDYYALRISGTDYNIRQAYDKVLSYVPDIGKLILIVDYGFIPYDVSIESLSSSSSQVLNSLVAPPNVVFTGSSFPSYVVQTGYGGDGEGDFYLKEKELFQAINAKTDRELIYGDYGTIHPERYHTNARGWVARIDFPANELIYYYRNRAEDYAEAYAQCARSIVGDRRYDPLPSWGCQTIESVAAGNIEGKSPSFWISVRMNIHITRQCQRD